MASVQARSFDEPDEVAEFGPGRSEYVTIGEATVVRSILDPGWSWDEHIQPMTGGLTSCPLHHLEYVISGHVRYDMEDGSSTEAGPGTYLDIPPGHRASVVGTEPCVLLDWGE